MARFLYTARNITSGETKGGSLEVKDEHTLAQHLRDEGFLLTSSKSMEANKRIIKIEFLNKFTSVPLKEKMLFARNLSVMISSGLTITRALYALSKQTQNKRFQKILENIEEDLKGGNPLGDALAKHPGVFNELFVNMVRVGEVGGNLEEVLRIIATQLEKEHALISKVRGAMLYPSVIVLAMVGIGILMLTYILPKITSVFADMDVTLPATTQFIIQISNALRDHSILVGLIFVFLGVFSFFYFRTPGGKRTLSYIFLHIPFIKEMTVKINSARFARIYSSLLRSGVNVTEALQIISRTLTNYYYQQALKSSVDQIQKGVNLSVIMKQNEMLFPVLIYQIIEVGEETGKTEEVLLRLAEFYEEDIDQITKNLSSIIEPVLMLVIGSAVGFFAVAMLQPMYSVMENIK